MTTIPSYSESISARLVFDVTQFRNGPVDNEMTVWEAIGRRVVAELTYLALSVFALVETVARVALTILAFVAIISYLSIRQNCCSDGVRESLGKAFENDGVIAKIGTGICMGPITAAFAFYLAILNPYKEQIP